MLILEATAFSFSGKTDIIMHIHCIMGKPTIIMQLLIHLLVLIITPINYQQ